VHPAADRWLRRGALALSLTLAASVTATFAVVMWPRVTRAVGLTPPPPAPAYRSGHTTDTPADWAKDAPLTLVVFAQSACGACQSAKPFLRDLVAEVGARATVVLASHGPDREVERAYGREIGLDANAVKVTPDGLRVRATPTLVLFDRRGTIIDAWEGVGPAPQQQIIRKTILTAVSDH
jgi:hypothetical protein